MMGLGTSPTMSVSDRIRRGDTLRAQVYNLGEEADIRLELHFTLRPPSTAVQPMESMKSKRARLPVGGAMRFELRTDKLPLLFDKSGTSIVRGDVFADSQPAAFLISFQRIDVARNTSVIVGWGQFALGETLGKTAVLARGPGSALSGE